MIGNYASKNGKLIAIEEAVLPIDHIEFGYGFAVYENTRLRKGTPLFLDEHCDRLIHSAKHISLSHSFKKDQIKEWILELISKNDVQTGNIKILLIGGSDPLLYIFMLAPKYLEKKDYKKGVKVITKKYERFAPQAKTLNMLPSYVLFKEAQKEKAFDALLIDSSGNIHEGTRSNFFAIKGTTLYTPPLDYVLDGITRKTVIQCAKDNDYDIIEQDIPLSSVFEYDGAFLTNTSGKIVPIASVDGRTFDGITDQIKKLIQLFNESLQSK